ncbi:MAG TPA: methylcobamide--CoM methyltransferase [Ruminiclostridium sp.]|nr:methylcobamide--CoM methyltransferase [Clostridiaceae bacterium]HAA25193.1 methylcobamide--CoM methyltransferase [Ruminiclostridium sp.]
MHRNMKEWIKNICNDNERAIMPLITYPGAQLVKKKVIDIVKDGEAQFECIKAICSAFNSAAAVMVMDLSVEAEAFGSPVQFSETETPVVSGHIVSNIDEINSLTIPQVGEARTGAYIKAAELASKYINDRPVFGGIIGPYSLAGRLFGMSEIMVASMLEPDSVHALLSKTTSFLIDYALAFKEAGADGIIIAEPAAGLLSPTQCQEFSSDYVKKIVDSVQDEHFIVILHNCGNTENLVKSMLSTGSIGLHFGNAVDMKKIMPQIPNGIAAFGNIDPAGIMKNGSPEEVREKTMTLLKEMTPYKNFILSTGCDTPPGTPFENIHALYKALDDFNEAQKQASA